MVTKLDGEKKQIFLEIYDMSEDERVKKRLTTAAAIYRKIGTNANTYRKWLKLEDERRQSILDKDSLKDSKTGEIISPEKLYNDTMVSLYRMAQTGKNSQAAKHILTVMGKYVEKKEENVKVEISVAERIQIASEIVTGLREQYRLGNRNCAVCGRPPVLLGELCEDRGQDTTESGSLQSIPISS